MSESKTSEKRLKAAERQRRALELRKAGVGFDGIARQLGYSGPSGAYKAVMTGLKKTLAEPASELRTLEAERLDSLLVSLWPLALRGRPEVVDRVVRIMERRSRLLGLDTPPRLDLALEDHSRQLINAVTPILVRHLMTAGIESEKILRVANELEEACLSVVNR